MFEADQGSTATKGVGKYESAACAMSMETCERMVHKSRGRHGYDKV